MKKIKRVLIYGLITVFSLVSLSSCQFFERALQKIGLGGEETTTTETSTSEAPYQPTSINNPITEPTKENTSTSTKTSTSKATPTTTSTTTSSTRSSISTQTTSSTATSTKTSTSSVIDEHLLDYGYNDLTRYGKYSSYQSLYILFNDYLNDFYKSTSDISPKEYNVGDVTSEYYEIAEIEYTEYGIDSYEALAVFKSVLLDHSEYYFISNTILTYNKYVGDTVTNRYLKIMIDEDYKLGSVRLDYNNKIALFLATYESKLTSASTEYEKVKTAYDYIIENASYAYESDGKTPSSSANAHNMIGIVAEKKGVCESYAELFTYLLKSVNVGAITINGMGYTTSNPSGESHAWNYAKIDGKYYGFDVTWGDTAGRSNYFGMSYEDVTYGKTSLNGRHSYYSSSLSNGFEYLYQVPSCSTVSLDYI